MIIAIEYLLCTGTALLGCVLLMRAYRRTGTRLLFWSGLCFGLLALSNTLVLVDKVFLPDVDEPEVRIGTALLGVLVLLYGLIFEREAE
jgi:hypothetical protein